jgi:hypothetical protein
MLELQLVTKNVLNRYQTFKWLLDVDVPNQKLENLDLISDSESVDSDFEQESKSSVSSGCVENTRAWYKKINPLIKKHPKNENALQYYTLRS